MQRGIAALKSTLGEDAASTLLQAAPKQEDEAAGFYFPLPIDYMGEQRRLRIGFPLDFPRKLLKLHVEPSPWLGWPHVMKTGELCLHGFQERPITGSPEFIVRDSLLRLKRIVSLSVAGSNQDNRDTEFQNEITSYWSWQHDLSSQNLILLDRPECASKLLALSDPRFALPSGQETVWLATNVSTLAKHCGRVTGRFVKVRNPEIPGFYVKLQSYPDIRVPNPKFFLPWLTPHLKSDAAAQLLSWFDESNSLPSRWIALELPGDIGASIYCLNIRSHGVQKNRSMTFGLRAARRRTSHKAVANVPALIRATTLDVLDRASVLSRDLSGKVKSLENTRVVCVGVGSLGGAVAQQLARSGVAHLTLIDPDTLESANLGRHVLGIDDLGRKKAFALREKICRDLPTVEVDAYANFAEEVMLKEPVVFTKADLIIVTTADWQSEVALWEAKSSGTSWGLLQAWSEPHTQVGHALFSPNGAFDARCLFNDIGDFKYKYTEWPRGGFVPLPACGESFIPGGSLGMMNIASMVSHLAIRSLTGHAEAIWVSSIYRPQDIPVLGGKYYGPDLPDGVQQMVFERRWPDNKEGAS